MLLEVKEAEYIRDYIINLKFNNGDEIYVDLKTTLLNEKRNIFKPLLDKNYFKDFSIKLNTICWKNEADFAPEFLYELGMQQEARKAS